jgi:hypothetical protein
MVDHFSDALGSSRRWLAARPHDTAAETAARVPACGSRWVPSAAMRPPSIQRSRHPASANRTAGFFDGALRWMAEHDGWRHDGCSTTTDARPRRMAEQRRPRVTFAAARARPNVGPNRRSFRSFRWAATRTMVVRGPGPTFTLHSTEPSQLRHGRAEYSPPSKRRSSKSAPQRSSPPPIISLTTPGERRALRRGSRS